VQFDELRPGLSPAGVLIVDGAEIDALCLLVSRNNLAAQSLADIFVRYTSSDRAAATLGSGHGAHTARNAHLPFMGPSRRQSDKPTSQDAICAEATSRID
jgi:hypothetical protein